MFPCSLASIIDEVDHQWGISSHGDLLGILSPNFSIL